MTPNLISFYQLIFLFHLAPFTRVGLRRASPPCASASEHAQGHILVAVSSQWRESGLNPQQVDVRPCAGGVSVA